MSVLNSNIRLALNWVSSKSKIMMTAQSLIVVIMGLMVVGYSANAVAQAELAVPAKFLRELDPPGTSNSLLRPEQVFIDKRFGEVFVVDAGNNRTVVFDTAGVEKFEFSGREEFGSPADIVVSSAGYIFMVGTRQGEGGSVYKFDYDGAYLGRLELTNLPDSAQLDVDHLAIDNNDILYLLTGSNDRIVKVDGLGQYVGEFKVLTDLEEKERQETALGSPRIDDNRLYVPVASIASVYVYDLSGELIRTIGMRGNNVGTLNFPIAVDVIDHSIVVVLDKHRFNVVCFTTQGAFLGEFGGMGYNQGWFYHPQFMAVDGFGRIYISQVLRNRVQVCELPSFIAEKARSSSQTTSQTNVKPLPWEAIKEEVSLEIQNPLMYSRSFIFE